MSENSGNKLFGVRILPLAMLFLLIGSGLFISTGHISNGVTENSTNNSSASLIGNERLTSNRTIASTQTFKMRSEYLGAGERVSDSISIDQNLLLYNGGPVMHNPTAYAIFWLPSGYHFDNNDSRYEFLITRFLQDLAGSSYLSIVTQYPDNTLGSPSDSLSFGGSWLDTTAYKYAAGGNLSEFDFSEEIEHAINVNNWPEGTNNIFFVFTAENVIPQYLEQGFCAYHSYFVDPNTGQNVVWANMPDLTETLNFETCQLQSLLTPNFDTPADSTINILSHELFESITDPLISGWIDLNGQEVGDKCAWTFGSQVGNYVFEPNADVELNGHYYEVQQEWSNSANACTLSGPTTFADTITLTPYNNSALTSGDYFPVTYTIGGQPFTFDDTGGTVTILTDPFTTVTIDGSSMFSSTGGQLWCFDYSCDSYYLTSTQNNIRLEYFELLTESVSYYVSDGSSITSSLSANYTTAPYYVGPKVPIQTTLTLFSSPQQILVSAGTSLSLIHAVNGTSGERWVLARSNYTAIPGEPWSAIEYLHQYYVMLRINPDGSGSLTMSSNWYNASSSITLLVIPNSGWNFSEWIGLGSSSYSGPKNPVVLVVNSPVTEEALVRIVTTSSTTSTTSSFSSTSSSSSSLSTATTTTTSSVSTGSGAVSENSSVTSSASPSVQSGESTNMALFFFSSVGAAILGVGAFVVLFHRKHHL
jgi:hypothetical protein